MKSVERWYPLRVVVCTNCWLVQTEDYAGREEFFSHEYAYFSSSSSTWLSHCKSFVEKMVDWLKLNKDSLVLEVAANDGYLLQFVKNLGVRAIGVEPTESTASAAKAKGLDIVSDFFGVQLAQKFVSQGFKADLTVANNVLAHVPDINDFVQGFVHVLKPDGVASFEFPHLIRLVEGIQFDTIYHEHYSYLTLTSVHKVFEKNGLQIFDVEELPTHGGSLRVLAQRFKTGVHKVKESVQELLNFEIKKGITSIQWYEGFQEKTIELKLNLLEFLIDAKRKGLKVAAYGAAAKGNTLLNYAGVKSDLLEFVCDSAVSKQGKFLPGSRIPVLDPSALKKYKPDLVIVLPWNLRDEIMHDHSYIRDWGAKFVFASPKLEVV